MKEPLKKDLKRILAAYQDAINLNIICSTIDIEGNITYVNQKFCEKSQYSAEELIGQNHRIINSGHHPIALFKNMWLTIKSGKIWQGEVKSKAKDGSFFWLHSVIIPIFDDHKNITQFFSLRFPIDEKKKREEEIKQQAKLMEEMLFMISHKVRQPIANILGIASLLDSQVNSPEEILKMVDYINESTKSLDIFAKELTSFIEETKSQKHKDLAQ
jgi:PAS domain S-box-containing protein